MWICVDEAVGDDVIPAGRGSVGGMWELATWAEVDCRGELKGSAVGYPSASVFLGGSGLTGGWLPLTAHSQPHSHSTIALHRSGFFRMADMDIFHTVVSRLQP